jgi:hypothetical protein
LILDLASVAYQSDVARLPTSLTKEQRQYMPLTNSVDIHEVREAWRRSKG